MALPFNLLAPLLRSKMTQRTLYPNRQRKESEGTLHAFGNDVEGTLMKRMPDRPTSAPLYYDWISCIERTGDDKEAQ